MHLRRQASPGSEHILQYVTGGVGGMRSSSEVQDILNFGKRIFGRFGILLTVPAGMSEPHSFATRTAAECAVGAGGFMLKQTFRDFVFSTNTDGSGKAASYVRVLDMLGPILTRLNYAPNSSAR